MNQRSASDEAKAVVRRSTEEVAKAVVFLASDDSSGITGKELFVGAGFSELGVLLGDDLKIN